MNFKLALLLLALVAITACLAEDAPGLHSEDVDDDLDDDGLDGDLREEWGRDVLNEPLKKYKEGKKGICIHADGDLACKSCCEDKGMSHIWSVDLRRLKSLKAHRCTCNRRT